MSHGELLEILKTQVRLKGYESFQDKALIAVVELHKPFEWKPIGESPQVLCLECCVKFKSHPSKVCVMEHKHEKDFPYCKTFQAIEKELR